MDNFIPSELLISKKYKESTLDMLKKIYPEANECLLSAAIDDAINEKSEDHPVVLDNNYKNIKVDSTLLKLTEYILDKKPIITSYGVMFARHGTVPNPIFQLIQTFIDTRKRQKKMMFKYPKGSDEFNKYNLLQQLSKIDVNGFYGACGKHSCIYYNLHVASSVTTQGRSCNSAMALLFESILGANVPFESLNELVQFIHNVCNEDRHFHDREILDRDISIDETFFQLMSHSGFGWIPSEKDMEIVWRILLNCTQEDLNRLFYKNNLYNFMDNINPRMAVLCILDTLKLPFMDPNDPPEEIKTILNAFCDLLKEYVYYDKQIIDRLEKMDSLIRSVSIIQDTDSAIISFDGWYRYMLQYTTNLDLRIKHEIIDPIEYFDRGTRGAVIPFKFENRVKEYDFLNDSIIEVQRSIDPEKVIPQDGLRFSIINIMAYCIGHFVNDYMSKYAINSNSDYGDRPCFLSAKNEFLFSRVLLVATAKKNYASIQEVQEGNIIPKDKQLDIKGLPAFVKSSVSEETRKKFRRIMYEDILSARNVDQIRILKDIALIEKEIYLSIQNGEKKYFKPVKVKSLQSYDNPMRIQGIKASYAYNLLHEDGTEALDLDARNSVDVIKCDMNPSNIDLIKDKYPEVYGKALDIFANTSSDNPYGAGIDSIALPANESVPGWILPFVKYTDIINDNVSLFPLESIGLARGSKSNNYTNIVRL